MWRRVRTVFPIFVLAILVRVFAPGEGSHAVRTDALASTVECSLMAAGIASQQMPSGHHHQHHPDQCCLFCEISHTIDPTSAETAFSTFLPFARYIAWIMNPPFAPFEHASQHARARAPLSFS